MTYEGFLKMIILETYLEWETELTIKNKYLWKEIK